LVLSCVKPISSEMVLTISFLVTSGVPYENGQKSEATPSQAKFLMTQV
jgi:hypothetical protein